MSWRAPYILQALLALVLAVSCHFLPMSPRWLLLHGRRDEALRQLDRLDYSRTEAEKDILRPSEENVSMNLSAWEVTRMLFRRQYRTRTFLALTVLGMVQLSGIDGVLYVCQSPSVSPSHHLTSAPLNSHLIDFKH